MKSEYDVIVVGARVAGATLAYELAQAGYEVLVLDENMFPSDTLSMPTIYGNSLAMLSEMGVLDRLQATGAPTFSRMHLNLNGAIIDGDFPGNEEESSCLCVRRLFLDNILLDQAKAQSGVRVLEGFKVVGVIRENGAVSGVIGHHRDGRARSFKAKLVVGADGRCSEIRESVGSKPVVSVAADSVHYVAYVSDFLQEGEPHAEYHQSKDKSVSVFPTNRGQYAIGVTFPLSSASWLSRFSTHAETAFRSLLSDGFSHTTLAARFRFTTFAGRVRGLQGFHNDWHQGMGDGWALVGDALSFKDPRTGQGIHDALYSARLLAAILADYDPKHWGRSGEHIGRVYHGALEKKLMSRFRMACGMTSSDTFSPEAWNAYRSIGSDPQAVRSFLGVYNHMSEPEDVWGEAGRQAAASRETAFTG